MDKSKVLIENPAIGGSAYTSLKRAQDFIRRGHAKWTVNGVKIRLLERAEQVRDQQEAAVDLEILLNRKGIVNWRGSRPRWEFHRPGEVVS